MSSDVQVTFGADIGALTDAVKKATGTISDFADNAKSQFDGLGDTLKGAAAAFGIGFGADALKDWVQSSAELGETMENVAAKLGTTAQQASQLSGIAALTGTAFQSLQTDMERFNLNLGSAGNENSRVAQGLKALGLSAREFVGVPIPQQLELLAQAASKFADGGNKTAAIMALLGRSGAEMIPYLDKGKEGIEELQEVLSRTGATMSDDMASAFAKADEDIHEMGLAWQGLSNTLFAALDPAIDSLIRLFNQTVEEMTAAAATAGTVRTSLDVLAISAKTVASAFTAVLGIAESTMSLLVTAVEEAVAAIAGLGRVVQDAWNHNWSAIASDAKATWSTMKSDGAQFASDQVSIATSSAKEIEKTFTYNAQADAMSSAMAKLRSSMGGAVAEAKANFSQIGDAAGGAALNIAKLQAAFSGMGKPQAGAMEIGGNKGAEEALEGQLGALNREIEAYKAAEQLKQNAIESEVKTKTISAAQGATAVKAALDDELAKSIAVYKQEETLVAGQPQKLSEVLKQEQQLQEQYAEAVQKLQIKAAEQSAEAWEKGFKEINSAFDSQISGLIKGTTSWGKAFQNILDSLLTDVIKFFVNWGLQQAENTALQILNIGKVTTAQVTGSQLQLAAQQQTAVAGAAAGIGNVLTSLANDAKAVFGGVFAFLAPILGPAAAAPAAAASSTVLAGGLAVGAWELPSDMIVQAHKGEMVVPAGVTPFAQALMANATGAGGGDVHNHNHNWNVNVNGARDPSAVVDEIEAQAGRVMKTLGRSFSSSRNRPRFT